MTQKKMTKQTKKKTRAAKCNKFTATLSPQQRSGTQTPGKWEGGRTKKSCFTAQKSTKVVKANGCKKMKCKQNSNKHANNFNRVHQSLAVAASHARKARDATAASLAIRPATEVQHKNPIRVAAKDNWWRLLGPPATSLDSMNGWKPFSLLQRQVDGIKDETLRWHQWNDHQPHEQRTELAIRKMEKMKENRQSSKPYAL